MKVNELVKLLKRYDQEKELLIKSSSGMEWKLNEQIIESQNMEVTGQETLKSLTLYIK